MTRRPLPALVGLLALLVLTAIVWWRVANRDSPGDAKGAGTSPTAPRSCTAPAPAPVARTAPSSVTVRVLNSTGRSGIAGRARQTLIRDGFRSPDPAGDDSATTISASAQIRYASGSSAAKAGAQLLQYYLPGSVLKAVDSSSAVVTVSLGNAFRSVAPASDVRARLAKATATASGATDAATPTC